MKQLFIFCLVLHIGISSFSQTKAKQKPVIPAKKPTSSVVATVPSKLILKNLTDSASYALGCNIAQNLKKDLGDLNTEMIIRAMKEEFSNHPALFDETTAYSILSSYSAKAQEEKSKDVVQEGLAFLEKNKTKPGVITTSSGLQYEILKQGTGTKPTADDSVTVHYSGSLLNGTVFDASYDRNEPLTIQLGQVIKGWTEGVQLMNTGSKFKFYLPYELGYGLRGAPPTIPGGSVLTFEIELLEVKKTK